MAYGGYRKVLKAHGLKLKYDDSRKKSEAIKCYENPKGAYAAIMVDRKKGDRFSIRVFGCGEWRKYFLKEQRILAEALSEFGHVDIFK